MEQQDLSTAKWRKSSFSGANNNCVEIADNLPGIVAIRDSKNPDSPALTVTPAHWAAFTAAVKVGEPGLR
jgi:Domain of unknown function (DUF397)